MVAKLKLKGQLEKMSISGRKGLYSIIYCADYKMYTNIYGCPHRHEWHGGHSTQTEQTVNIIWFDRKRGGKNIKNN